jgi:membrane protein
MKIPAPLRVVGSILKSTVVEWYDDDASRLAASLAFYTTLSLAPLLLVAISIAGIVFGDEAARGHVSTEVGGLVGATGAEAIETILANAQDTSQGVFAAVVGAVVLLFGASGVFAELQAAMDKIWEVKPKDGRGVWGVVRDRFTSFTMVLGVGFLLLVSLIVSAVMTAMTSRLNVALGAVALGAQILHIVVSLAMTTVIFALIFKVVPDAKIRWRDVWVGALATSVFFTVGKLLIGLYLGHSTVASTYGAAGSVVVILVWVYYSAQLLFFGAELTQVLTRRWGRVIEPADGAISIRQEPSLVPPAPGAPPAEPTPPGPIAGPPGRPSPRSSAPPRA